jgi:hypothetical protein
MMLFDPGIHFGRGPMPPSETLVRSLRPDPSSATAMILRPLDVLRAAAIVPCGTTLMPVDDEEVPAVAVTVYLPIADALTTPALLTVTPGADTA